MKKVVFALQQHGTSALYKCTHNVCWDTSVFPCWCCCFLKCENIKFVTMKIEIPQLHASIQMFLLFWTTEIDIICGFLAYLVSLLQSSQLSYVLWYACGNVACICVMCVMWFYFDCILEFENYPHNSLSSSWSCYIITNKILTFHRLDDIK